MSVHVRLLEFRRKGMFWIKVFSVPLLILFKDLDQQQTSFRTVETHIRLEALFVMLTVEFFSKYK